jgi:hypothetical protein
MRAAAYALRSIREPYTSVQYDQLICMVLRSGSFESGVRRSEMKKYAYDAGGMILAPRHVEQCFRTDDLRYGLKLVDARVRELITAVNAEKIAGFPNGPLFLDSAEQELAGALVDRHAVRLRSASVSWRTDSRALAKGRRFGTRKDRASPGCRRGLRLQNAAALCASVTAIVRSQPNGISARISALEAERGMHSGLVGEWGR